MCFLSWCGCMFHRIIGLPVELAVTVKSHTENVVSHSLLAVSAMRYIIAVIISDSSVRVFVPMSFTALIRRAHLASTCGFPRCPCGIHMARLKTMCR